jgi:TolA-binding protein
VEASSPNPLRRAAATAGLLLVLAAPAGPAAAQLVPLPMPPPPAPPLPTGNVQRSLSAAFGAISAATAQNPAAAQQANFLYQSALQRYRAGDFAAAAAEANAARALAAGTTPTLLAPVAAAGSAAGAGTSGQPGFLPPGPGVPGAGQPGALHAATGSPGAAQARTLNPVDHPGGLPDDLLRARNEIELAAELDGPLLEEAKKHYRAALDAYLSGDRAKELREAGASFALAEQVLEKPPKP